VRLHPIERLDHEQRRRWAAARVWAAHQVPYMATALLALDPVVVDQSEDPGPGRLDLQAFPVDDAWHVYVDPEVLEATPIPTLGFWLVHQVSHLLRHHGARSLAKAPDGATSLFTRQSDDQRTWNVAADAEINDDLVAGDAGMPSDAVTPNRLGLPDALTAEEYFDALEGGIASPRLEPADCGSGCDGIPRPWDSGQGGLSKTGSQLLEHDVARRIKEHQRRIGNTPAGWQRWADELLEPAISWQRLLASAVRRGVADVAGRVDFSYRKPSRRTSVVGDVVLPSLRQPLPKVAMVLDTSGSMSDHMLAQSLAEVGGVLRSLGVAGRDLKIVCCDAKAFEAQKVMKAKDVQLLGGGGTDMGAGLAKAAELRPQPDLVIVLTDGFTPWPQAAPNGIPVIVGLMDPNGSVPPWAKTIVIGPPVYR
jgi:predicted metal-dependent peptidase